MIFKNLNQLKYINNNTIINSFYFINKKIKFKFSDSPYKIPYNINLQQHRFNYLKKVQKAQKVIQQSQNIHNIPRRKRRIYDKPRFDLDISNYQCFRDSNPQNMLVKFWGIHSLPIACKIDIQPKWLVHAFGRPSLPVNDRQNSTGQYLFRDLQLSTFLMYDYRMTTDYMPNAQGFDYQDQAMIRPGMRLTKRQSKEQFWQSQIFYSFRVCCSRYGYRMKFKQWILNQIQKRKSRESYDQYIDKKFGKAHAFNIKGQQQYFVPKEPMIKYVTPQTFETGIGKTKVIEKKQTTQVKAQKKKKKKQSKKQQQSSLSAQASSKEQQKKDSSSSSISQQQKIKKQLKGTYKFSKKLNQQYRVSRQVGLQEMHKVQIQNQ